MELNRCDLSLRRNTMLTFYEMHMLDEVGVNIDKAVGIAGGRDLRLREIANL